MLLKAGFERAHSRAWARPRKIGQLTGAVTSPFEPRLKVIYPLLDKKDSTHRLISDRSQRRKKRKKLCCKIKKYHYNFRKINKRAEISSCSLGQINFKKIGVGNLYNQKISKFYRQINENLRRFEIYGRVPKGRLPIPFPRPLFPFCSLFHFPRESISPKSHRGKSMVFPFPTSSQKDSTGNA